MKSIVLVVLLLAIALFANAKDAKKPVKTASQQIEEIATQMQQLRDEMSKVAADIHEKKQEYDELEASKERAGVVAERIQSNINKIDEALKNLKKEAQDMIKDKAAMNGRLNKAKSAGEAITKKLATLTAQLKAEEETMAAKKLEGEKLNSLMRYAQAKKEDEDFIFGGSTQDESQEGSSESEGSSEPEGSEEDQDEQKPPTGAY